MTPERWQHIEEIFQTALDLAPQERARYLTDACTGDAELQREVETLLTQYEDAGDFIDEPLFEQSGVQALASLIKDDVDPLLGLRMGSYQIEQEIGRGGMGAVYLASRADNAFQKRVAIKVVKRGMDTDFILRRFRHERQILANLDHPNIARLLDGGATADGRPYFVMEYIEGQPIYHYCDARRLNARERLRLFAQVCDAVDYAHRNQVIHRDIKPSNILVNNAGMPKLFDFGIAKLLNPEMSDSAPQTATAMRLMTVEYASPEQVQGLPVTFLSDIYSLGVLLYELLTGHRPYHFRSRMLHEMARVISEEEPERPSIVVNRTESLLPAAYVDQEALTIGHLCEMRGETPDSLRCELMGCLDNITLKALCKEQGGRYQSAAALREDIMLYLEGRPVSAPLYVSATTKFEASEKRIDTAPKEISIAVLPFRLIGARPSDDTGDEYLGIGLADALITRLSNVRRFIVRPTSSVLQYAEQGDPLSAGSELDVEYIVDGNIRRVGATLRVSAQLFSASDGATRWSERFDEKFTDVLELEDTLSAQIAGVLIPQLTGEEQQRLAKRGTDDPQAYEAYLRGRYHWHSLTEEGFARAIQCYERAIEIDPHYALAYAGIADYYIFLGIYCIMPFAESSLAAKQAAQRAVELDETLPEAHAALAFALVSHDLNFEAAEEHYHLAIKLNPNSVIAHNWYSFRLLQEARFDEALAEVNRAVELDPITPVVELSLAWCHYHSGRFIEAVAVHRRIVESEPRFAWGRLTYGWALTAAGMFDEAITQAEKANELGGGTPLYLSGLAIVYAAAGRVEEAREIIARLLALSATHYVSPYFLATIYCQLGDKEQAFAYLFEALKIGDTWVTWLIVDPLLAPLRSDPRSYEILRRINNPAAARLLAESAGKNNVEKSIAVLPFKLINIAMGDDTDERYLGVGLADALIARLSNVRSLSVRPTSAILRYDNVSADSLNAGRELGVRFVLDGRIKQAGERIRISLQLLDVESGASVWAHQLDQKFTDALSLEDAISEQLAEALISQLTTEERHQLKKRGTDNPEAFEAYLRGRYYWNAFTVEGFAKALLCYNRAVAYAPDYALAYTGIADYYIFLGVYAVLPFSETAAAAKEAALKALELDDALAEAHSAFGIATLLRDLDWQAAERHLRRAVELNPNYAMGHAWRCHFFGILGRFDEAIEEARRAIEIDPLTPYIQHTLNWAYYYARRYEESIASTRRLISNEPQYGLGPIVLCLVLWQTGSFDEAIEAGERGIALLGRSPYTLVWLASAHAAAGHEEEALRLLEELKQMSDTRYVSPYLLAMIFCNLNETEQAFRELERACEINDARLLWLGVDPQLDRLRADPRFADLLHRINYPALKN